MCICTCVLYTSDCTCAPQRQSCLYIHVHLNSSLLRLQDTCTCSCSNKPSYQFPSCLMFGNDLGTTTATCTCSTSECCPASIMENTSTHISMYMYIIREGTIIRVNQLHVTNQVRIEMYILYRQCLQNQYQSPT